MSAFTDAITERVGPLPAWAWGLIAAGGIIGVRFVLNRRRGDADDQVTDDAGQADAEGFTGESEVGGVTYRPAGGALFPTYDVRGAVSDPGSSGSPADPNARPPWLDELIVSIDDQGQRVVDTIASAPQPIIEVNVPDQPVPDPPPAPAPAQPAPAPAEVPPPPQPAPQPRPAPQPVPGPAKGTILWTGAAKPNPQTINNLVKSRYPGASVRWETRERGPNAPRDQRFVAVVI